MASIATLAPLTAIWISFPAKSPSWSNLPRRPFSTAMRPHHPPEYSAKPISENALISPIRANPVQKYTYPNPDPEFAVSEAGKFKVELTRKLSREKEEFGDELDAVVNVCTEIFREFLDEEYGGPGTLLVEPFTDMMIALKEKKLPGAPLAARSSLLWAQNFLDRDWQAWKSKPEEQ